jgi:drug/metabolite transporter (DMT)-like permease
MTPITILILLSVFYVLAGASNAGFNKYIVSQKAFGRKFSHSWFLNLIMFIGESMGIPVYYILFNKKEKNKPLLIAEKKEEDEEKDEEGENKNKEILTPDEVEEEKKPEINKFYLAIPAFTDTCSTGLANIGLILLPASIYQMLKGSLIIMTFLMSKFFIRNKHILDHYIAIPVSTLGVILVGLSAYMNASEEEDQGKSDKSDASQTLLGIILMLIAMFILSIQFCFDEYFMRKYKCHPLICIGYQGVFGFFINLFLCFIFYFIKCGSYKDNEEPEYLVENMCTGDDENVYRPENIVFALRQYVENKVLTALVPIAIFFMSSFNILGVSITKYGSATTRSVTDNIRSFLVWLWFLLPFNQEDLIEHFNVLQLIGFLCISMGAFIYNGIFKLEERKQRRNKKIILEQIKGIDERQNILDSKRTSVAEN